MVGFLNQKLFFLPLDLVSQRISKSNDPISIIDFVNSCYIQFQELHSSKNFVSERNQKGLILKIGNRRSSKHYRIYTNKKNNFLIFKSKRVDLRPEDGR